MMKTGCHILLRLFLYLVFLFIIGDAVPSVCAQTLPATFRNPVMPGFNPDPSICRVGNDYYMVTSSFTWYPGIPVYRSRDLVNWELIGHVINRPGMINMEGLNDNNGIWAATIRYHNGLFYVITTASKCGGNFYCTATDPAGKWSDPIWLKDAEGIDPSLFWDDDGRCYYTGNTWSFKGSWPAQCAVWMQELDLVQKRLTGQRKFLTYGYANNARYAEGPHLYKTPGGYMLLMAEGGSGHNHAVTVHHSRSLWGPYTADQVNPVLTHRHLGQEYPVQNIGHADLVQTQNGEWYSVVLGNRITGGLRTMGRETFLCKVDFENNTPIYNKGYGRVLEEQKRPDLPWTPVSEQPEKEEFNESVLPLGWYTVRIPRHPFYHLSGGCLQLDLQPQVIDSLTSSAMLLRKIKHLSYSASVLLNFKAKKRGEQAGLILYRSANGYMALMKERGFLSVVRKQGSKKEIIVRVPYNSDKAGLKMVVNGAAVQWYFSAPDGEWKPAGPQLGLDAVADDGKYNKFNGPGVGVYATANLTDSHNKARYEWFEYKALN